MREEGGLAIRRGAAGQSSASEPGAGLVHRAARIGEEGTKAGRRGGRCFRSRYVCTTYDRIV